MTLRDSQLFPLFQRVNEIFNSVKSEFVSKERILRDTEVLRLATSLSVADIQREFTTRRLICISGVHWTKNSSNLDALLTALDDRTQIGSKISSRVQDSSPTQTRLTPTETVSFTFFRTKPKYKDDRLQFSR
jgi:hypothetical protein